MYRRSQSLAWGTLLCTAIFACVGCAALGFAPIASVANFGYAAWTGSRLEFVEDAGFERVTLAAERALIGLDLSVELTSELRRDGIVRRRVYQVRSERGDLAMLTMVRLTPTMTDLTLDVGILGNRPAGELMADHIRWYTDGDTIRASRRAAMESFADLINPDGTAPGARESTDPQEPTQAGPDFGNGLF